MKLLSTFCRVYRDGHSVTPGQRLSLIKMNFGKKTSREPTDMDEDDKDESKRKMRNLSEKKRRDQFNTLINELCTMVSHNNRKMDKSMVLKSTIAFLRHHNDTAARSQAQGPQEDWQPPFMTDEELVHLMLEALDGFILVFSTCGKILYVSESVASLLGHLPNAVLDMTIYDLLHEESRPEVYRTLTLHEKMASLELKHENTVSFSCHIRRRVEDTMDPVTYELVRFTGSYKCWRNREGSSLEKGPDVTSGYCNFKNDERPVFVAVARIQTPQLLREIALLCDATKNEFTSRHSLEWKFLFLDHRASPIIGYLPFEVLGTSGYDYYHADDLERVAACHEALMQTGEGKSCYFRFLTKGQQWIWLQTHYYITYHQWNSKPEFIVCNHTVASYNEARTHLRKEHKCDFRADQSTGLTSSSDSILPKRQGSTASKISSHCTKVTSAMSKLEHASGLQCSPDSKTTEGQTDHTAFSRPSFYDHPLHSTGLSNLSNNVTDGPFQSRDSGQLPICSHGQSTSNFERQRMEPEEMSTILPYITYPPGPTVPKTPVLEDNESEGTTISVLMTSMQNQLQEQLRRKQQALQEQILKQQEELKIVQEQLLLSQYGSSETKLTESRFPSKVSCNTTPMEDQGKNLHSNDDSFPHPISSGDTQPLPSTSSANQNFDQQVITTNSLIFQK